MPYKSKEAEKAYRQEYERLRAQTPKRKALHHTLSKALRLGLRQRAFDAYGGRRCIHCGDDSIDVLTLDHINNDGAKHREALLGHSRGKSTRGGWTFYRAMERLGYPPGLQVLCMGCNWAKRQNGGVLPAERKDLYRAAVQGRDRRRMTNVAFAEARLKDFGLSS